MCTHIQGSRRLGQYCNPGQVGCACGGYILKSELAAGTLCTSLVSLCGGSIWMGELPELGIHGAELGSHEVELGSQWGGARKPWLIL
jgi:hypothetical protein